MKLIIIWRLKDVSMIYMYSSLKIYIYAISLRNIKYMAIP